MKFTVDTSSLAAALSTVTRALSARATNPALDGILIQTEDMRVRFTCSDSKITIATTVAATVEEHGNGIVPGKLFAEFVRKSPAAMLKVSMSGTFQFRFTCGGSRMSLAGLDPDLFPLPPTIEGARSVTMPQNMLADMIAKVLSAVAQHDMREVLTGVFFEVKGGNVYTVGLDGFRLAQMSQTCSAIPDDVSAIIPGETAAHITRLAKGRSEDLCALHFGQTALHVGLGGVDIYSMLLAGEYVDYRKIIPTDFATRIVANTADLRQCVERAAIIARAGNSNLLRFRVDGDQMHIESTSEIADVHEVIDVAKTGNDISIAFNVKYIVDVLGTTESEEIEMAFNASTTPCVITPVGKPAPLDLVLPVRTA